ncbi:hypothetical protein [Pseudonocardia charpentierae]|uniref:Uncharacterized protein n=1 Tax=Pseudonocardia charpentierae TaxID=3075545 RepID=A0ABU2NHX8_9PSEU|nr:hypothetical protein [Pseudonocardia sp. DSM 45834]MDT0353565.1 hypothetical protein [Pseudonocardia sp. DSM 45834]
MAGQAAPGGENGDELVNIEQTGGTGPVYTGDVYNGEWQFRILHGKVSEFS